MKTSIYISVEQIQAIGYSGSKVKDYVTFPLPEGTMYNGTITDLAFLAECLTSMKAQHRGLFSGPVSLVADGGAILCRAIASPKLSDKQYKQLVRDDFADSIENPLDLVCGYRKMTSDGSSILACAVNKTQVDSYISAFNEAGIKLESIHIGVETVLSLVEARPELQSSTIVINVIDGFTMLSMLFDNGRNVFMSRSRLYGDLKEQVLQNALDGLNGLIQFTRSQKFGDITRCYYLGAGEQDFRLLETLNPYANIEMKTLDIYPGAGTLPPDAHFAALNMLYGEGGIDLAAARRELDKYVKSTQPKRIWIPAFVAYCILLALPALYLGWQVMETDAAIRDLRVYIESPDIVQRLAGLDELEAETMRLRTIERQAEAKNTLENSRAGAESAMIDLIIYNHGEIVTVTNFDFDELTGIARISARCLNANVAADYVDTLKRIGVAEHIDYRGYGSDSEGMYTFTIDITVKN